MSKQLAVSAAFSIFAMAAFALVATAPGDGSDYADYASAETLLSAPIISLEAFAPAP